MFRKIVQVSALLGATMSIQAAPYGTWESPITPQSLVQGTIQFKEIQVEGDEYYWAEARPEEKGRTVIIRKSDNKEMIPAPYYARTTVYEYGGSCFTVHDKTIYFTNFEDQHLYKVEEGKDPQVLNNTKGLRFADFVASPDGNTLYAITEDHDVEGECKNYISSIDTKTGEVTHLAKGYDFYAFPRISPEGDQLAYICWNHPNMPWDGTELFVLNLKTNDLRKVAGGESESIAEPRWTPCNQLVYVSDRDNFWQLYTENGKRIIDEPAEFTFPLWRTGVSKTAFVTKDERNFVLSVATVKGSDHFICKDLKTGETFTYPDHEFSFISELKTVGDHVVFVGMGPKLGATIFEMDPISGKCDVIKKSKDKSDVSDEYISVPQLIEFPTTHDKTAFAFYYPPQNPNYKGEEGENPPLITMTHGGPTAHMPNILNSKVQFWTTRGFAVVDVNYGGSTGYGREYRDRLKRNWGEVDVDDCCNAALFLAKEGKVDGKRMAIEGGSAGGYTTLASLTFRDVFAAGCSYFGVSDLTMMLDDTHKYEARYLDSLVGKYPEEKERYIKYSPLHHTERLSCPILLLQGKEDKIVPPNQAEVMYDALLEKKIPTSYLLFDKEQHGFRIAENIIKSLEAQLYFYKRIFDIPVGEETPPIKIINLDD